MFKFSNSWFLKHLSVTGATFSILVFLGLPRHADAVQLLTNGNFDSGHVAWVEDDGGSGYFPIVHGAKAGIVPQSGAYMVWLGGLLDVTTSLYQDVAIPAGSTGLQLAGYRLIGSEEFGGSFDFAWIRILNTNGVLLETLFEWDNTDTNTSWLHFAATPSGNYAGQTIRLQLIATCDDSYNTNFFFDTLELTANVATDVPQIESARSWALIKSLYR